MWKSFASLTSRDTSICLYIFHPEYSGPTVLTKDHVVVVAKISVLCNITITHNFIVNIDIYDVIGMKYTCIHGDI